MWSTNCIVCLFSSVLQGPKLQCVLLVRNRGLVEVVLEQSSNKTTLKEHCQSNKQYWKDNEILSFFWFKGPFHSLEKCVYVKPSLLRNEIFLFFFKALCLFPLNLSIKKYFFMFGGVGITERWFILLCMCGICSEFCFEWIFSIHYTRILRLI